MKKYIFLFFVVVCCMALASCGSDEPDTPDKPDKPNISEYEPLEGLDPTVPLLNGYDKIVGYQLWSDEKIPDVGLTGEGFSFDYWEEHKREAQSFEELRALCEIPQEQLDAMSTRNLVQTCFVYPYNEIYGAYNNIYIGIMSAMKGNCWQELMKRETGATQLLDLYCELTYPTSSSGDWKDWLSYLDYKELAGNRWTSLSALTLVMMTAVDSKAFTPEQLTRLAGEIFNKIDNMLNADEGIYTYAGSICYPYLLGAFIAYRYDRSLSPLELSLLYDLTGFQGLPGIDLATERVFTAENVASALDVVTRSLERIEQGSLLATAP